MGIFFSNNVTFACKHSMTAPLYITESLYLFNLHITDVTDADVDFVDSNANSNVDSDADSDANVGNFNDDNINFID